MKLEAIIEQIIKQWNHTSLYVNHGESIDSQKFTDCSCIDDDYMIYDADDTVCDDGDGLLPEEIEEYEKEERETILQNEAFRYMHLFFPVEVYKKYIQPIKYYK